MTYLVKIYQNPAGFSSKTAVSHSKSQFFKFAESFKLELLKRNYQIELQEYFDYQKFLTFYVEWKKLAGKEARAGYRWTCWGKKRDFVIWKG